MTAVVEVSRRWAPRAGLSLLDQGLLSGTNFVANILLARWLSPSEYGAFAIAFSIFLILAGLHSAFVLEPMSVLGATRKGEELSRYVGSVIWLHIGLTASLALVILIAALLLREDVLGTSLIGLALSTPLVLLFWTVRRVHYLETRLDRAALGSFLYAVLVLAGLFGLWSTGLRSGLMGFLAMGAGSILVAIIGLRQLGLRPSSSPFGPDPKLAWEVGLEHWRYGRWVTSAIGISLAAGHAQTLVAGAFLGLGAAATLRAMQNLTLPIMQVIAAAGAMLLPVLSREFAEGGRATVRRKGFLAALTLAGIAIVYELMLVLSHAQLEYLLYGGKFASHAHLVFVLGFTPVFTALAIGPSIALRAARWPQHYLIVAMVVAPLAIGSAVVGAWLWGLEGTAWSVVLTCAVTAALTVRLLRRRFSQQAGIGPLMSVHRPRVHHPSSTLM